MPAICEELRDLLSTVRQPGDFYATGRLELLAPRLVVEGVGQIALPLLPVQAEQLIAVAKRAPYGRGSATIVDTDVRRTWQIGPDQVHLGGKHWKGTLDRIVALAAEGLGISEPVSAKLYKLLIYDKGSFFVSHRDTEKEPGMFATLVLALPSLSSAGSLSCATTVAKCSSISRAASHPRWHLPPSTPTACTRFSRSPPAAGQR